MQASEDLEQFWLQAMDIGFNSSVFTCFANDSINFLLCLGDDILNTSGMDAPIQDEPCQCNPSHFTADRIEARENDCFRCIIDDEINTCCSLQGTNTASLAS